jgi:hypothetical protein
MVSPFFPMHDVGVEHREDHRREIFPRVPGASVT